MGVGVAGLTATPTPMTADHTSHTGHSSHATPTAPPVTAVTASPRTPNCPAVVQPPERGQFRLRGIGPVPAPVEQCDIRKQRNHAKKTIGKPCAGKRMHGLKGDGETGQQWHCAPDYQWQPCCPSCS